MSGVTSVAVKATLVLSLLFSNLCSLEVHAEQRFDRILTLDTEPCAVLDEDFKRDFSAKLVRQIRRKWNPPKDGYLPTIAFCISQDGAVSQVRLVLSAGSEDGNLAAKRAVENAAPFPALPKNCKHINVKLRFNFADTN